MEDKAGYLSDYWFWRGEYTSRNIGYIQAEKALQNAWEQFINSDEFPQDDKEKECYILEEFGALIMSDTLIDEFVWAGPVARTTGADGCAARILMDTKYPAGGSPANSDCVINIIYAGEPVRNAITCRTNFNADITNELWEWMGIGKVRLAKMDNHLEKVDLSFDLSMETEVLIAEARRFIEWAKDYTAHRGRGESLSGKFEQSPESRARSVKEVYFNTRAQKSYQTRSDASRAIGLWLWDYMQEHSGTAKAAILAIRKRYGKEINAFGFATTEENVFRGWLRRTKACIDACEVLAFT